MGGRGSINAPYGSPPPRPYKKFGSLPSYKPLKTSEIYTFTQKIPRQTPKSSQYSHLVPPMTPKNSKISTKTTFWEEISYIYITFRELLSIIGKNFSEKSEKI
jgi:hypothetical protein